MKESFKLLELRISYEETQLKRSQGKAKNRHGRFHYFDCLLTKNIRVKWLLFLRHRVKKAEESLKLRHNFISRCSKADYLYYRGMEIRNSRAITVTATDKVIYGR